MPASESGSVAIELEPLPKMDRLRKMFTREPAYQPLESGDNRASDDAYSDDGFDEGVTVEQDEFSWIEYSVFLLLGMAMLWAWFVLSHNASSYGPLISVFLLGICSLQLHPTSSVVSILMTGS